LQEVVSQLKIIFKELVSISNSTSRHRFSKKVWAALQDILLKNKNLSRASQSFRRRQGDSGGGYASKTIVDCAALSSRYRVRWFRTAMLVGYGVKWLLEHESPSSQQSLF
jgi:hypothetical protein